MESSSLAPSKASLADSASSWAAKARDLRITDAVTCGNASQLLKSIKAIRFEIAAWFAPHIDAAMETKRKAEAARKGLADEKDRMEAPLVQAESAVKRALLAWEYEQEQVRREQERQLQAEAQRLAETQAVEAAAALERDAVTSGDAGMLQEAHDILDQPVEAPVVSVASLTPKVAGIVYRDQWKAHDDIDVKALAAAVADGRVPQTFLVPNMPALHNFARATQGMQAVPGVKFWNDRQIAARR